MRAAFEWLDLHPQFYWCLAIASAVLLAGWVCLQFRPDARPRPGRRAGAVFAVLLLFFLLAWRWPYLFAAHEYNPDESQFIAGALTLAHDPVFWRSVDGVTSGPLDFYALLPLHLLGLPLDYFEARLTGLLLCWAALLLLHRLLRSLATPGAAALAVLPCAMLFATVIDPDFVHYSSELVPLALLAWAVAWAPRRPRAAAFLAGWLPWAKLQAVPLAGVLLLWLLWQAWRERPAPAASLARRWARLLGSFLGPTLLVAGSVALFGQFGHLVRRYVLQNVTYVGEGLPLAQVMDELMRRAMESGQFVVWAGATAVVLAAAVNCYVRRRRQPSPLFWLGAGLAAAAVFCILLPSRASLHYLLFITVPLVLCTGTALADLWPQPAARRALVILAAAATLLPFGWRLRQPAPGMFGRFALHWQQPFTPLGSVLHAWHKTGGRLALWGWLNSAYVEAGLPQGTRDTVSQWCMLHLPQEDYYRATYLADMQRNRPELFVDAVGPGSPFFNDRATQAHEIFPELAAYIREHYRLVVDLQLARVYARNDFLAQHPLSPPDLQRLVGLGRAEYGNPVAPDRVSASAPKSQVDGHEVQMIEPGRELAWQLDGTERKVRVNFGFHPKAWLEGKTDGAEFVVELRMPGQPPLQVIRRPLNPQKHPDDRLPLVAEADLPPFPAGSKLAVISTPGQFGDSAWDWVYLDQLRFSRSPFFAPRQFPGFRRLPDQLEAAYPYLVRQEPDWLLMLPPPTSLTFVLGGTERQFNFAYGLAEGAYTGPGQSDGAVYRVELQRGAEAPRVIFERHLVPLALAADRGRQYADLTLPADVRAGDRLVLRIEAGQNNSWDWTYVAALDLR
jgi:hypothetical protein